MSELQVDIIVVGGGLVGASLASRLSAGQHRVALIEGHSSLETVGDWDQRIYAISRASRRFLQDCGAWQRLDPARLAPIRQMRIFGDQRAELRFDAHGAGLNELAIITESRHLQHAIWQGLDRDRLTLIQPARPQQLHMTQDRVSLTLDQGQTVHGKLLVGADGAQSWVRQQWQRLSGSQQQAEAYGQSGVVANFSCSQPHQGTAWQWFQPDGSILAWLPLPGQRMSMVWSCSPERAQSLLALDPASLAEQVAAAGQHQLGDLQLITPAAAFPLRALVLPKLTSPRLALIGDAAHLVHPLAGQGVNLGFQDARDLAQVLLQHPSVDPGLPSLLQRYERMRRFDILAMHGVTKSLHRLFNQPGQLPRWLRNTGLTLTDRLPLLKQELIRHALG
ncbi:UbiH/UbiF family hydroxylase [Leeia sp.]|uniref:UbiH/UbiF family hydroxylase n=1 Tax=Leeia sp. TaxID=2884678 RepID=UPI0035B09D62